MNLREKLEQAERLLNEVKEEMQKKVTRAWPQVGDTCWIYSAQGPFAYVFEGSTTDSYNLLRDRAFQTKEQCEADFEARKVIYELKQQPGCERFVVGKAQWAFVVNLEKCTVFLDAWAKIHNLQDSVWFESREAGEAAIKAVGKDRILKAARWFSMGEV